MVDTQQFDSKTGATTPNRVVGGVQLPQPHFWGAPNGQQGLTPLFLAAFDAKEAKTIKTTNVTESDTPWIGSGDTP